MGGVKSESTRMVKFEIGDTRHFTSSTPCPARVNCRSPSWRPSCDTYR